MGAVKFAGLKVKLCFRTVGHTIRKYKKMAGPLEIANLALLTLCTEFEFFCDQILSFEVL